MSNETQRNVTNDNELLSTFQTIAVDPALVTISCMQKLCMSGYVQRDFHVMNKCMDRLNKAEYRRRLTTRQRTSSELLMISPAVFRNYMKDNFADGKCTEWLLATIKSSDEGRTQWFSSLPVTDEDTRNRLDASVIYRILESLGGVRLVLAGRFAQT